MNIYHRLKRARRLRSMGRAFDTVLERQRKSHPADLEERRLRLRRVREEAVGNPEFLGQAIANLEKNAFRVLRAATIEEAQDLIVREIGEEKLVVKAKSNLTREVGLEEVLAQRGVEVIDTDIGDRIIQLAGDHPSHPTGPASHLDRYDIARILSRHLGREVEASPQELTSLLRQEVSGYIQRARIGITGANAICAEEGAVVLLHNEGNIQQVSLCPGKHLILAGTDRIYPNLEEAINLARLLTYYATGDVLTSFINVIGGPSKTADIEKKLFRGVHGPQEVVVILVDNHRSLLLGSEFRELLYCIGCGECLLVCPAYRAFGPEYSGREPGGRGAVLDAVLRDEKKAMELCLTCGRCYKNCPLEIDIPAMVLKLRKAHLAGAWEFLDSHLRWLGRRAELEVWPLLAVFLSDRP